MFTVTEFLYIYIYISVSRGIRIVTEVRIQKLPS
jgi:hypothetical protein